jgi:ATP-dependent DNA helicase 2 subunit 1
MAVLLPQEEEFTEGGGQDMPPGFHVIVLPFVDDIRAPPKAMTENLLGTPAGTPSLFKKF